MNTDSSQFITGREVAVLDMLNARDRRHAIQQELIRTHNATVISFTLNIPGPIKVFPLGEMTFEGRHPSHRLPTSRLEDPGP